MQIGRRRQADLRGTSFGLPALDQDRLLASTAGARAWAPLFCTFLAALDGIVFVATTFFFLVQAYRRIVWVSVQASIFLVLLRMSERLGTFSTGSSTGPHITSSPPFSPTKEPRRSFQQQGVPPSLAHPATRPHLLGTNAPRCASVDSHGSNALNC